MKIPSTYTARAKIIKAMAHPTRLFLIDRLADGERCVCELTDLVGADASTVSKHLSLLKSAGIVAETKRGNKVFCKLQVPCIMEFFPCIEAVMKSSATRQLACCRR